MNLGSGHETLVSLEGSGQDYPQPEVQLINPILQHGKKVIEPILKIGEAGAETLEIATVKLTIGTPCLGCFLDALNWPEPPDTCPAKPTGPELYLHSFNSYL